MRGRPRSSARALALQALHRWYGGADFADSIVQGLLSESSLSGLDRAFAQELFYGVLRNLTLLDFWIGCLREGNISAEARDLLRLGFYQLFLIDTPAHAAVYETVELAAKRERPVINAVLRAALRGREKLRQRAGMQPAEVQFSHAHFLLERWQKQFGEEATNQLCLWNNQPPPLYARINQLKTTAAAFLRAHPGSLPVQSHQGFARLQSLPREALERGECYMQDPSAAMACRLLDPRPGEKVLDACAAPGGKAAYLAELMENRGVLIACDREPQRLGLLRANLARLDVKIATCVRNDWTSNRIAPAIISHAPFDRILVDAPCTNTGVMRRRVDVRWRLRPDDFARMQKQQMAILRAVLPLLQPGGVLVYSTCSMEQEENEAVIEWLSRERRGLAAETSESILPFRDEFDGAFAVRLKFS